MHMKPEMQSLFRWYDLRTGRKFDDVKLADELSCCLCVPARLRSAFAKFKRKSRNDRRSLALSYLGSLFPKEGT